MLEKLLVLLGTGKGTLVALTLGTSVVVTGTIGGQVVDLVITPVVHAERTSDPSPASLDAPLASPLAPPQIEVVEPKRSGPSCGELIGTEKGKRIALLQASWYERHSLVMSYNDRDVERSKRETYKALVGTTKVDLQTIRDAALAALHAQAARVDEACRAGLPTAELVARYDVIVTEAVRDMDAVRDSTVPILAGMSGTP